MIGKATLMLIMTACSAALGLITNDSSISFWMGLGSGMSCILFLDEMETLL